MATQIKRPDTAFALATTSGKKRPREHDKDHLKFVSGLPCLITGTRPVDVAHIRYADPRYGKRQTGGSEKPHDKFTVPLCRAKHDEQHSGSEREFWAKHKIDPIQVALALWANTGDDETAEIILRESRP
jgi:hypothetical protein